jgi:hypothetical protein
MLVLWGQQEESLRTGMGKKDGRGKGGKQGEQIWRKIGGKKEWRGGETEGMTGGGWKGAGGSAG